MSVDLHYRFYPKKCIDKDVLPFLDYYNSGNEWLNGKYMPTGFYDTCRELAVYDEENECYIFDDCNKLFKFASRNEVPPSLSDYISYHYSDKTPIFIIWIR